jgi:small subunit ribosomal protein S1
MVKKKAQESKKRSAKKTKRIKKSGQPQTMADLLKKSPDDVYIPKKGERVLATISEITPRRVFFDIEAKTEGVLFGRELERVKDFVACLAVGDKVETVIGEAEDPRGQILLNLRNTAGDYAWGFYQKNLAGDKVVEVVGQDQNAGGILVQAPFGLTGFIPGSCLGAKWVGREDSLIGEKIKVKAIEVDREKNRLVFSERAVSEANQIAKEKTALGKLKEGKIVKAKVTKIAPFGLFVEIEQDGAILEGLVHISEVSWEKVNDLGSLYQAGNVIKAKVVNKEGDRLQLSIKQLKADPWEEIIKKYPKNKQINGKVTKVTNYGWLVELDKGIEGLVHISKIPTDKQAEVGDSVKCFIDSIDPANHRISLGLVLTEKPVGYK